MTADPKFGWYRDRQLRAAADSIDAHREMGVLFDVQPIGPGTKNTIAVEWSKIGRKCPHWNWDAIAHAYKKAGHWAFAIRHGDRLVAVVAARAARDHVLGEYIEGDPGDDAPLKRQRAAIAVDLLIRYAEACNVNEVRVCPLTEKLAEWYQSVAPFEPFPKEGKPAYYVLRL